jgi:hypothetical protein
MPRPLLLTAAVTLLLAGASVQAFLLPSPQPSAAAAAAAAARPHDRVLVAAPLHAAGQQLNLRYGDLPPQEDAAQRQARQQRWETEYKAYVKRNGAHLCALSWRGYQAEGRGGILAKYEAKNSGGEEEQALSEVDRVSGVPSMYVSLARWMESGENAENVASAEKQDLQQILDRVVSYDPEKAFVVVFQAHGLMGADIVRPNISPAEMADRLMSDEKTKAKGDAHTIDVDGHEVLVDKEL